MTQTMRAIGYEPGKPLFLEEAPTPAPGPGEILIKVATAGLNRGDLLQREGRYPMPPGAAAITQVLGLEASGVVAGVGAGVTRWREGDAVCALMAGGGYAEFALAHEGSALPVPKGVSLEEAGGVPEATFTVWANVFESGALQPGETLLAHGGSSGIGVFAIQMARAHGATVFATAGDDAKCALIEKLGGRAINYKAQDFEAIVREAGGADVILDMVGGDYVQRNLNTLKPLGRLVHIALMQGSKVEVDLSMVMMKRLLITGSTLRPRSTAEKARIARAVEATVWPWIEAGKVKPIVDSVFPLEEAEAAHARMRSSTHSGKILLRP